MSDSPQRDSDWSMPPIGWLGVVVGTLMAHLDPKIVEAMREDIANEAMMTLVARLRGPAHSEATRQAFGEASVWMDRSAAMVSLRCKEAPRLKATRKGAGKRRKPREQAG